MIELLLVKLILLQTLEIIQVLTKLLQLIKLKERELKKLIYAGSLSFKPKSGKCIVVRSNDYIVPPFNKLDMAQGCRQCTNKRRMNTPTCIPFEILDLW